MNDQQRKRLFFWVAVLGITCFAAGFTFALAILATP